MVFSQLYRGITDDILGLLKFFRGGFLSNMPFEDFMIKFCALSTKSLYHLQHLY